MENDQILERLFALLNEKGQSLATAESCTGGLLSATITHKAGASKIFERGYITYSNEAKVDALGVSKELIEQMGAVSAPVSESMALGIIKNSSADLAIAITGIAGPEGGTEEKPVGTVFIGYALRDGVNGSYEYKFNGDRMSIRVQACTEALKQIIKILEKED